MPSTPGRTTPTPGCLHNAAPIGIESRVCDTGDRKNADGTGFLVAFDGQSFDDLSQQQIAHIRVLERDARIAREAGFENARHQHFDLGRAQRAFPQELNQSRGKQVVICRARNPAAVTEELRHSNTSQPVISRLTELGECVRQMRADRIVEPEFSFPNQASDG
jgi:hypothetical protein